jgi:hypothetical protein
MLTHTIQCPSLDIRTACCAYLRAQLQGAPAKLGRKAVLLYALAS